MGVLNMKRYIIILTLIAICILINVSCSKQNEYYDKSISSENTITYEVDETINSDRLQKFIDKVNNNKEDRINLIKYTIEGDPIITQLHCNGDTIEIAIDRSKDEFGGKDKDIIDKNSIDIKELQQYLQDRDFLN